jgi:hypothetical protein
VLLLDSQIERLSSLEQDVLRVLALNREATTFGGLVADIGHGAERSVILEAVESLPAPVAGRTR